MAQVAPRLGPHRDQFPGARREPVQPLLGADPQAAVGGLGQGVDVARQRLAAVLPKALRRGLRAGVRRQPIEPVLRADPERAVAARQQAPRATGAGLDDAQQLAVAGVLVQAAVAAQPDAAVLHLDQAGDASARQAAALAGRGPQRRDRAQLLVEHRHAAFVAAQPDLAGVELHHRARARVDQLRQLARVAAAHPGAGVGRVVALQAAAVAAGPDPAGAVAHQCADLVAAQAVAIERIVLHHPQQCAVGRRAQLQPAVAAQPDMPFIHRDEAVDRAVDGVLGALEHPALAGLRIDQREVALLGAGPEPAVGRLEQAEHDLAGQAGTARRREHRLEGVGAGALARQAAPGADPQGALAVDRQ